MQLKQFFMRIRPGKVSQLRLEGFKPSLRERIISKFPSLIPFLRAVFKYFFKKLRKLGNLIIGFVVFIKNSMIWSKEFVVKKLIWSRGRLGRPIANLIVLGVAFVVFTFGEVFNSTRFVSSKEINPDYLSTVTDIIPITNTTLTTVPDDRKRAEAFQYTIQGGDSLSSIGQRFKISVDALEYMNNLTDTSVLSVGDTITIPPVSGLIHTVDEGDTLDDIAETYDVAPQAIADFNYILDTSKLAVGSELVIPGATVPQPVYIPPVYPSGAYQPPISGAPNLGDGFIWPSSVRIITQYFSWYHNGLDIAVPWGWGMPPIYATSSGTVTRAGWDPWGLGLMVRIDHGNGFQSVYGHLSSINVGYGQRVSKGQVIGAMGNTGRSTGPHLHFIIYYNGVAQDPYGYVN